MTQPLPARAPIVAEKCAIHSAAGRSATLWGISPCQKGCFTLPFRRPNSYIGAVATSTILLTLALLMGSVSGTEVPTSQVPLPVWPSGVPGVTLDLPSSPPDSCNIDSTDEALVGPPPQVDPAAQELPVGPPSLDDDNPRRPARKAPTQTTPTQVIRWCISETANVRSAPAADRRLPRASQSELELTDLQIVHGPPTNAIVTSNAPDPELFHENGTWYLYTTGTRGRDVALYVSSDQLSWRSGGNALDLSNTEMWYQRGRTWAPAVERFGDTYVMYFTARVTTSDRQCIGAATSKTPLGPFRPNGALPMVCDTDGGSIDASVFTDASGDRYLLWKNDGNSAFGSGTTVLYSRKLNADGLGFSAEPARELARNSPNSWKPPTRSTRSSSNPRWCRSAARTTCSTRAISTTQPTTEWATLCVMDPRDHVAKPA